MKSTREEKE